LARTPRDLFRAGNASTAGLDRVRPVDVTIYVRDGIDWVRHGSGGISTYDTIDPTLKGKWWRLPAGSEYDEMVLLIRNDEGDHWAVEPARDMPLGAYRSALAGVNALFVPL